MSLNTDMKKMRSFKFFKSCSANCHSRLNLAENVHCSVLKRQDKPHPGDRRPVQPSGSVLQPGGVTLAAVASRSVAVQNEDSVNGSLEQLTPRQSPPQPPRRWITGARCTIGVPSRGSIGWSCRKCSTASSVPSVSGGPLGARGAPTLTLRQRCWNRCSSACAASLSVCTS